MTSSQTSKTPADRLKSPCDITQRLRDQINQLPTINSNDFVASALVSKLRRLHRLSSFSWAALFCPLLSANISLPQAMSIG